MATVTIYADAAGAIVAVDFGNIAPGPPPVIPKEATQNLPFDGATNEDLIGLLSRPAGWPRLKLLAGVLTWNGAPVTIHPPTQAGAEDQRIIAARKLLHSGAVPGLDAQQILDAVLHLIVLVRDHDRRLGLDVPVVVIAGPKPAVAPNTPNTPNVNPPARAPRRAAK